MNTNPTPKARFQESADNIKRHRELISSREFMRAIEFATLEMSRQITLQSKADNMTAIALHFQQVGAELFVNVLMNLSEKVELPAKMPAQNLDHRA
jgi:hypothetical protein